MKRHFTNVVSGTTANVGIKLYGDEARSSAVYIDQPDAFKRNGHDVMLLAMPNPLGNIWKLRVWHDNSGMDPSWYLCRIIVRDLRTNVKYYFLTNIWLSVGNTTEGVELEVFAASESL